MIINAVARRNREIIQIAIVVIELSKKRTDIISEGVSIVGRNPGAETTIDWILVVT
jgi:hypothetical protein